MLIQIETLRNQSLEDSRGFEQLQELEEKIKLRFNSSVIRQFQAQVWWFTLIPNINYLSKVTTGLMCYNGGFDEVWMDLSL